MPQRGEKSFRHRGFLSLSKEREPFVNGAEGCVRETRKGVLHDDDPYFSELFEVLKNASACRKDYFDTLTGRKYLTSGLFFHLFPSHGIDDHQ